MGTKHGSSSVIRCADDCVVTLETAGTPLSRMELALRLSISPKSHVFIEAIRTLVKQHRIHIASWGISGTNRVCLYSVGNYADAPRPRPIGRSKKSHVPVASAAIKRILSALEGIDLTAPDLADRASVAISTLICARYLKVLRSNGSIHICGWERNENGFTTPIYRLGPGVDVPRPRVTDDNRDNVTLSRIVIALRNGGEMDSAGIAKATGIPMLSLQASGPIMRSLLKQKRVYICRWLRARRGAMRPVFAEGKGANQSRPPAFSVAEKTRRYREAKKVRSYSSMSLARQLVLEAQKRDHVSTRPPPQRSIHDRFGSLRSRPAAKPTGLGGGEAARSRSEVHGQSLLQSECLPDANSARLVVGGVL